MRSFLAHCSSTDCLIVPLAGGRYLVELKPSVFVMDCLPNMNAETVNSRAPAVLKQLRDGLGPDVPIVVLEGHTYAILSEDFFFAQLLSTTLLYRPVLSW